MTTNSLVAAPIASEPSAFGGAYLLQDGAEIANAIQSGNWVEGGVAVFTTALDTVGMVIDPIGTLIANGLGWVLDHIEPLRGWLQDLSGNASEVQAFGQTWTNAAGRLQQVGTELHHQLGDLDGLSGATIDAYSAHVRDLASNLSATGQWAGAVGSGLQIASTLVQAVYELVRDAISQVVGTAISAAITTAATVGFGAPLAIGQIVTKVTAMATRIGSFVTRLLRSLREFLPLIDRLTSAVEKVLARFRTRLPGDATAAPRQPDGNFYSVAYQMELDPKDWAQSRSVHFNRANADLDAAMRADPDFAQSMESASPGISDRVAQAGGRRNPSPEDFIWHHAHPETVQGQHGVMQLVPSEQHTPGSDFWSTLHPGNKGGFSIWGKN